MDYVVRLDPLVRRQTAQWGLPEGLLVDVYLRLDDLRGGPAELLRKDSSLFAGEGMVYGFDLIDPTNRLRVHAFRFQVFYHADEQTLIISRGTHLAADGF